MLPIDYEARRKKAVRKGVTVGRIIGCSAVGILLFILCNAWYESPLSLPFVICFPYVALTMLVFEGNPTAQETYGLLLWACAPIQFSVYGVLLGRGLGQGRGRAIIVWLLLSHLIVAAIATAVVTSYYGPWKW